MIGKKNIKKVISILLSLVLLLTLVFPNFNISMFTASADNLPIQNMGAGSIGIGSNEEAASKLPRTNTQGTYRFTTDNYNRNHPALATNDWASNWLWDLEGDRDSDVTNALSGTAYAFPLCYLMKKDGLRVTKPSMTSNRTNVSAYNIKDNDTLVDFNIYPEWTCTNNNIDEITDWSYRAVTTNPGNSSQKMTTTMTQGSPFTYIELTDSNVIYIEKMRVTFPSDIIMEEVYDGCRMLVFRTNDITSSVNGYPSATYQYYAMFLPEGASVEHEGTTDTTNNDKIGKLKITLPSEKTYLSFAWVDESRAHDDSTAINFAKEYRPYAFNFITDTKADYSYNENTAILTTKYQYSFDKKSESTAEGTIMGVIPHQYKHMKDYSYMDNTAITLRGIMKFTKGSSYTTEMEYKGILPFMPQLSEDDAEGKAQLQEYVNQFVSQHMAGSGSWTLANDEGNETYYHGKKLNRSAQVVAAAKTLGDEENASKVLNGLEANLEEWFTYSGKNDKNYFTYLGEGVGVLLGFPTSFNAVDQFNDHHFHYGYFIESAACVGLWDKEWLNRYKDVVKQLIYDIASPYREEDDCVADCGNAYPYLRSFSPYEGHSWASGYEDERTGNNQESTSEAINAWAGIILFGELTGDTKIRDLGIYLYTSEIAAADNYWFDVDEDIYHIDESQYASMMASMVWGGKADYGTWFGIEYTQGIQICPMQSWSFYLLNGGKNISGAEYIKKFYNHDKTFAEAKGGSTTGWNDMWASYYALADPQEAMNSIWTKEVINDGESQAHTYHYIRSMMDYGTPDLSFQSDSPLASVFQKDGKYTYAVYNPDNVTKTVNFTGSNGEKVQVKASPNAMSLMNSEDLNKVSYTIEYYAKDLDSDNYSVIDSTIRYAEEGANVNVEPKEIVGFEYEKSNDKNYLQGTVHAAQPLTLKVYYTRKTYQIDYELNGGTKNDLSLYPSSYVYGQTYTLDRPTYAGYDFYGWYSDKDLSSAVKSITEKTHGDLKLYAKWIPAGTILVNEDVYLTFNSETQGIFTIIGDSTYKSVNVLYKIVDSESEAAQLAADKAEMGFVAWEMDRTDKGWSRTQDFSAEKGKYIVFYFIRYDDNGGYKTDYGYGKIGAGYTETEPQETETTSKIPEVVEPDPTTPETSKPDVENKPEKPTGLVYAGNDALPYYFAWAQVEGVTYNFYVEGQCIATGIIGGAYNAPAEYFTKGGEITVGITAVKDGVESDMTTITHRFESQEESSTTPEPSKEIITNENVKVEGYQISWVMGGNRVVGSVEPEIDGKKVEHWGFVYAIISNGTTTYPVTNEDIFVGSSSPYVASYESTSIGSLSSVMGESQTAKYFVRTMLFGQGTAAEFNAGYKVRAYALLEDGTYRYSDAWSYSVYKIADKLYQKKLMNTYDGHIYLYNKILKTVNPGYEEVDYNWNNTVVKKEHM